ncbi:sulfotransferase family protein [Mariprofundus sp. NF]|uniref:tetratricopeptide repeat-containing sulfotransferase family protein n=1 Tax=Mariprofundus sp. NF TaxID=2608716 RepID=UPI0015A4BE75|nr:sulfotransferase family protein [Mariprofundus sp. NF]
MMKVRKPSNNALRKIESLATTSMRAYVANDLIRAEQLCRDILKLHKNNPDAYNILGKISEKQGDTQKAKELYQHGFKSSRKHPGLIASLALLHGNLEEYSDAIEYWKQFTKLQPRNPDGWQALSAAYNKLENWPDAESSCNMAIQLAPSRGDLIGGYGQILYKLNRHEEAFNYFRKATSIQPHDVDVWYNFGTALMETGRFNDATDAFNHAIEVDPHHADSIIKLIRINKPSTYNDLMKQAEEIIALPETDDEVRAPLLFPLGKAWEDLKEYDKSFACYFAANQIRKKTADYNIEDDRQRAEKLKELFTQEFFDNKLADCPANGDDLIFIVGMPRSGSTLLAQILAAHPKVVDMGENDAMKQVTGLLTSGSYDQHIMENLSKVSREQLIDAVSRYRQGMISRFSKAEKYIDKTLPSFWLVATIRLLFPNAKIIHSSRDPLDNCLSIFSSGFAGTEFGFSYCLKDIGEHYRIYLDLMKHWRSVLPDKNFYEISNESLIAEPEKEAKSLVEFCDLEWSEDCMNFHKKKSIVKTMSLTQVREPINNRSQGRWKPFEKHLQPLIDALGDAVK